MRTRIWCVVVALSLSSAPAAGQTVLSEAEALARLSAESPRVRAIRAVVDTARAVAGSAGRWPNPRATFNREAVAGVAEQMVTVTQALPITGRLALEVRAASALVEASTRRADDAVRQARAELRMAYADLVSAQQREAELTRTEDRLRDWVDVLARREAAGEAAGYDRLRAERDLLELEGDRSAVRVERAQAQAALASFFGDPGDVTSLTAVAPDAAPAPAIPSLEALVMLGTTIRGEPAALQYEIASAELAERAAARRRIPEPEVVAGTKSSNVGNGDVGSVLSIQVSVPLFDRAKPERALARAHLAQAQADAAVFAVSLHAEIAALRAAAIERRAAADQYREASGQDADRLERIAEVSYEAGERGILELLDAYRSGASVRMRQVALDLARAQAEIALELVSGWESR